MLAQVTESDRFSFCHHKAMTKPTKIDWVALIDEVWDLKDSESSHSLTNTDSPSLSQPSIQMKLCLKKVNTPSDCEDPLKQPPQQSEQSTNVSTRCVETLATPGLSEPNTHQSDILYYLDEVYDVHSTKTPQTTVSSHSPVSKDHTPLNNSLSTIGSEARRLFPSSSVLADGINNKRKRKRTSLDVIELNEPPVVKRSKKKSTKKEGTKQLYLDFGQKDFGHVTCPTCGMVYTNGQPEDHVEHLQFHKKFVSGVNFPGWKRERVVQVFSDGRVILVLPSDPKQHLKKVEDILKIMDVELGFATGTTPRNKKYKVFLYISIHKRVMGCAVAEEALEGYQVLTDSACTQDGFDSLSSFVCSTTPQPTEVGINRLWVAAPYRRVGVGSRLLDTVRSNFSPGKVVARNKIAFTDPTPDGKAFAAKYCRTSNFLVYRWV